MAYDRDCVERAEQVAAREVLTDREDAVTALAAVLVEVRTIMAPMVRLCELWESVRRARRMWCSCTLYWGVVKSMI